MPKIRKITKKNSQKKSQKTKKPMNGFVLLLILLGIVYSVLWYVKLSNKSNALQTQIDKLNDNIEQEKIKAEELEQRQQLINSDEYIEEKAREMGMIKPDEKVYIDITK